MLKIAFSSCYAHILPDGHRFPMEKYALLPEQLLYEGTVSESNFFEPDFLEDHWILNTHQSLYFSKLKNLQLTRQEIRAMGFPISKELVEREIKIAGGSVQAARFALEHGISLNIAGGTHHAFFDRGEGFCLLNDIAITANFLLANRLARKILIVDLDVHQGNGTAALFQGSFDVFSFSMHGEKNYPLRKEKSHLDIGLPDGTQDLSYLTVLERSLNQIINQFLPDFIIYQSGVDVLASDQLGRLALSMSGIHARDKLVLKLAKEIKAPILCCMGGGYSKQIKDIIEAHAQVYRLAQDLYF